MITYLSENNTIIEIQNSKDMKFVNTFLFFIIVISVSAETIDKPLHKSNFTLSTELNMKYVWRGLEYSDAPVVFGTLSYDYKGFNAFVMGGYATNGKHSEVDLGLSYSNKYFTFGLSDYYYPSVSGEEDQYIKLNSHETGHSVECYLTLTPLQKVPVWMTLSTYVFGADKKLNGNQAYSSYVELGYTHSFDDNNSLSLLVGANLNKSFYTQYEDGFNVSNITAKYMTGISFGNFRLPISGSFIYNPYIDKSFFSLSIYFSSK